MTSLRVVKFGWTWLKVKSAFCDPLSIGQGVDAPIVARFGALGCSSLWLEYGVRLGLRRGPITVIASRLLGAQGALASRSSGSVLTRMGGVGNWRQVGPDRRGAGSSPASFKIFQTVEAATERPSPTSSP